MARISSRIKKALARRTKGWWKTSDNQKATCVLPTTEISEYNNPTSLCPALRFGKISDRNTTCLRLSDWIEQDVSSIDEENSSLVAMASSPSKLYMDERINRISETWIEAQGTRFQVCLDNSSEWDENDDFVFSTPRGAREGAPVHTTRPPQRKRDPNLKVRWMSPISTVHTLDSPECPFISLSPMSDDEPFNLEEIFCRPTTEPFVPHLKVVHDEDIINQDNEDDLSSVEDAYEMLRITFTPSDDLDDMFDCESPVAAEPIAIEVNESLEKPLNRDTSFKAPSAYFEKKTSRESQWAPLWKLLTLLLAVSCLTGHSGQLLNRFDVPSTFLSFLYPQHDLGLRKSLRRRQFQSLTSKFDSPGRFLDTRQSNVGVWLT